MNSSAYPLSINVLVVEDNLADSRYVEELLSSAHTQIIHVPTLREALKAIQNANADVILLDLSLPDSQGMATFTSISNLTTQIPIVILTGLDDEQLALEAVRLGAQDYIVKAHINENILTRCIRYAIERKRSEESIRSNARAALEAEQNLRMALSASQTGVWSWNIPDDIIDCDDQSVAILGAANFDQVSSLKKFFEIVHPADKDALKTVIETAIKTDGEYFAEFRIISNDGLRYISGKGRVVYDDAGKALQLVGVCRDITKEKMEEQTSKRLAILEQHEDFMATLTHDLKNPLIGANRLLQMFVDGRLGQLTDQQTDMLVQLKDSNKGLLELVQHLIEVYHFEKDVHTVEFQQTNLNEIIQKVADAIGVFVINSGMKLSLHLPDTPTYVNGHTISLQRVIRNLLDNALKFSPTGGEININLESTKREVILSVCDYGPGIGEEDQKRLFQRFSQGKHGKKLPSGSGLGLYLCKQIIDAHHGNIRYLNQKDKGATFVITLPSQG